MLRLLAKAGRLCDGLGRREFLAVGSLGALGLALGNGRLPAATPNAARSVASLLGFGRAKRCLLLFLTGGPPQHDTWDPKPSAPSEVRGEFSPIATNVPGIQFGELFPKLAGRAARLCVVRSVTHGDTVHTSAGYTMLTGVVHPKANTPTAALIRPLPDDHPHVGALLARHRQATAGPPTAVSLPEFIRDAAVNDFPGQDAGFLGKAYAPFLVEANAERTGFRRPEIVLPDDVTGARLAERRLLRSHLDSLQRDLAPAARVVEADSWYGRAFALLNAPQVRQAFALDREPEATRAAYGPHLFGQSCLLARRLLEAGVSLATVYWHYEGPDDSPVWDTHWNNFRHLRTRLAPPTDQALAALFDDLADRGMLDDTLVVCLGEFGRSPRVNHMAGRDHWPHVQSILLAGAGVPAGATYGASDAQGAYPNDRPVSPADLLATILHLLGVPADFEIHDRTGRPLRACQGEPVAGLVG